MPSDISGKVRPNLLHRWEPTEDKMVKHSESKRLFADISKSTGLSIEELKKEILDKKRILDWMVENNIRDLDSIATVIKEYYIDPESVIKRMSVKK